MCFVYTRTGSSPSCVCVCVGGGGGGGGGGGDLRMGLLPDTLNCGLRMRWECRERFRRHWLQRNRFRHASRHVHHSRAVMHVGIANPRWRENLSRHCACATSNFSYLARGPLSDYWKRNYIFMFVKINSWFAVGRCNSEHTLHVNVNILFIQNIPRLNGASVQYNETTVSVYSN